MAQKKLYHLGHYIGVGAHYAAGLGLMAGAVMLCQPWVLVTAAALTGGIQYGAQRVQKRFFETKMQRHDENYDFAPELGEIARDLYAKSGLKAENYPLYDFAVDQNKMAADKGRNGLRRGIDMLLEKVMEAMSATPNAAAVNLGQPVIMVSKPLLKLLDNAEEKAVLAHEFAHAAARHHATSAPLNFMMGVGVAALGLSATVAFFSSGWGILAAIVASGFVSVGVKRALDQRGITRVDKSFLGFADAIKRKRIEKTGSAAGKLTSLGVATYFNPLYLGAALASTAASVYSKVVKANFSKANEFQADRGAVVLGADPLALITALRKIELVSERSQAEAFGGEVPKKGMLTKAWKKATATHPVTDARIKRLANMARAQKRSETDIHVATKGELQVGEEHTMSYDTIRAVMLR